MINKALTLVTILFLSTSFVFADNMTGPNIYLRSTASSITSGQSVKVTATLSEPVLRFASDQVSVDGGNVESVRKLSPISYLIFVRVAENTKTLDILVEASKVQNLAKVYNEYSSNNLILKVSTPTPVPAVSTIDISTTLSSLLEQITKNTAPKPVPAETATQAPVQPAPVYANPNTYYAPQPVNNYGYQPYTPYTPYSPYNTNNRSCAGYDPYYDRYDAYCESMYNSSPYTSSYYTTPTTSFLDYFGW